MVTSPPVQNDADALVNPEVNDVVEVGNLRGVVRAVHPDGHLRIASKGDTDEGLWVLPATPAKVMWRPGQTDIRDTPALNPMFYSRDNITGFSRLRAVPNDGEDVPDMEVYSRQLHPLAWAAAMDLAEGDWRRIEVVDATHFTVHNKRVR